MKVIEKLSLFVIVLFLIGGFSCSKDEDSVPLPPPEEEVSPPKEEEEEPEKPSFETSGLVCVQYSQEKNVWYAYHPYPGPGLITLNAVKGYEVGTVLYVSYKVYLDKIDANGMYPAENVIVNDNLIFTNSNQSTVQMNETVPSSAVDNSFLSYALQTYEPGEYFGNRWIFSYKAERKGDQTLKVDFYYDKNKQNYEPNASEATESIEKGGQIVVLDVRLKRGPTSGTEVKDVSGTCVANFTDLRTYIRTKLPSDKNIAYITFRYTTVNSNGVVQEQYTRPYNYCGMSWEE